MPILYGKISKRVYSLKRQILTLKMESTEQTIKN